MLSGDRRRSRVLDLALEETPGRVGPDLFPVFLWEEKGERYSEEWLFLSLISPTTNNHTESQMVSLSCYLMMQRDMAVSWCRCIPKKEIPLMQ